MFLFAAYRGGTVAPLRLGAGMLGFVLLLLVAVIGPLRPQAYRLSSTTALFLAYACGSCLLFAVFGGAGRSSPP